MVEHKANNLMVALQMIAGSIHHSAILNVHIITQHRYKHEGFTLVQKPLSQGSLTIASPLEFEML
jgi:hypothetical protein